MPTFEEVINNNNLAVDQVLTAKGPMDASIAELVLSNTAVLADRIGPEQFRQLGEAARKCLESAAASAVELCPPESEAVSRKPDETDVMYEYRTGITQPLHSLKRSISRNEYDTSDPDMVSKYMRALWLGNLSFELIIRDPKSSSFDGVQSSLKFFAEKAGQAAELARYKLTSKS